MIQNNAAIEKDLTEMPDQVAEALKTWRIKTLNRERTEALLYARFKGEEKRTGDDIKAMVKGDPGRYEAVLEEITAESEYNRLYEKLLSAKKLASLRTAF